jgi:predicted PhzF superfamily epimerase YddE/YHI9
MSTDRGQGALPTQFGTLYPKGYVIVVVADEAAAGEAQARLRQAGWGIDDVTVVSNREMRARFAQEEASHGALEKLASMLASDERVTQEQYIDLAERGCWFVFVHLPEREQVRQLAQLVEQLPPVAMHHYGANTMSEVLTTTVREEAHP